MAPKKGSMFGDLAKPALAPAPVATAAEAESSAAVSRPGPGRNTTREGRIMVATFLDKDAHKRLRQIALDEDTDVQTIVYDALNLFFRERKLPQMAPRERVQRGPKRRA
jgi:hypothetical protein